MKPQAECPDCGKIHDLPFSHRLLNLYRRYQDAKTKEERTAMTGELAEAFLAEHDLTDPGLGDEYHSFFEDYEKARLALEHENLKLTRLAVHVIHEYVQSNKLDLDTLKVEADLSTN